MSDLIFNPVQGPEHLILNKEKKPGFVYFSTDTGKIFLDIDNTERIAVGGSGATVLYSSAEKVIANTDDTYTILYSNLDDQNASPKSGDLIINSDGRFFKVNYYNAGSNDVNCKLIAVSGTGGGNYPGGSDQETNPKAISVTYHDLTYTFLNGKEYTIDLTPFSQVDSRLSVSYSVRNAQNYTTGFGSMQVKSGEKVSLPVGQYITPEGGMHAVDITIEGANSISYFKAINKIKCIDLKVESDPDNFTSQEIYTNNVSYYIKVKGQIQKVLYVEIDNNPFLTRPLAENSDESQYIQINCEALKLSTGVHTIKAYVVADGVSSNIITTDFIYHQSSAPATTYVVVTDYPQECMSYETPVVSYWVYNTAYLEGYKNLITLVVNGSIVETDVPYEQHKGQGLTWTITGLQPDFKNVCEIICDGSSRSFEIICHYSNIFDPVTTAGEEVLFLSAEGRTNNTSLERRKNWSYTNSSNQTYSATLQNFNWNNNGWVTDSETQRDCLRISNGASVEIDLNLFEDEKPATGGYTFEFEFKPYNLYSYNLLTESVTTQKKTEDSEEEEIEVIRDFDASLAVISYISTKGTNDGEAFGLCCGTQDAFVRMSDGKNIAIRYTNDRVIDVAITIDAAKQYICMYINGVMSGMVDYDRSSSKLPIYANKLLINSNQCDLDLYNIRIYKKALTSKQIVQNYIANIKDMTIYNQNNFEGTAEDNVSLSDLQDYNDNHPDNATIPYIIFKTKTPDILPFNKANDDIICSIEFVNPALDYALIKGDVDEDYYKKHAPSFTADDVPINVQGTSSQKYPRKNFKGKFKKAKNWQCREQSITVNDESLIENTSLSKFYFNDDIAEKTICWKADYMDSSSCHNTGFANFAQELYKNHPLDYYEGTTVNLGDSATGEYHKKYRTTLYGFPVLAFHQKSNGSTEFIGLYNFNLDKGADDTLGMSLEDKHPILTDKKYAEVCECWEMGNNKGGRCSFRGNPFDYCYNYNYQNADGTQGAYIVNGKEGSSDLGDDIEVRYHINGDAIEGAWINSTLPEGDGGDPISSKEAFEILLGGDANGNNRTGAYAHLEKLYKWLQSCYYAFDMSMDEDKNWANDLAKNYAIQAKNNEINVTFESKLENYRNSFNGLSQEAFGSIEYENKLKDHSEAAWYVIRAAALTKDINYTITTRYNQLENNTVKMYDEIEITTSDEGIRNLFNECLNNLDTYQIRTDDNGNYYTDDGQPVDLFYKMMRDDRKTKFESEFNKHLNMEYCMVYYIMTELLLMYDSRGKNMMLSSWGPIENGGEYIWFPIFYDIDTQLGVNNSGVPSWEYNVEPTTGFNNPDDGKKCFSSAHSLLWNNFHQSYAVDRNDVRNFYRTLRGGALQIGKINSYYNFNYDNTQAYCMKGILPISIMNANQNYKYIAPSTKGYVTKIDDETNKPNYKTTNTYFYCLQGTRELYRAQLLRNRFNYYDSKWMAQAYQPGVSTEEGVLNWRANSKNLDIVGDQSLVSNLKLNIKPALDQYLVAWPDDSATYVTPIFTRGGEITEIDLMTLFSRDADYQQQIIHIGGYNYLQEFGDLSLLYLDEFSLPADAHNVTKIQLGNSNDNYDNNVFPVSSISAATSGKYLLKLFDITNIENINTNINLSDSVKLETFKAIGSKITGASFADGVNLQYLYLPDTINSLELINASNLTRIIYDPNDLKEWSEEQNEWVDTKGLYIDNVIQTNVNGKQETSINTINIKGGNLKLYSYELLEKIVDAIQDMNTLEDDSNTLAINMENVHWTPYTQLGEGATRESNKIYKYATNNYSFVDYTNTNPDQWNKDILNGRVYEYNTSPINAPSNLSLLDTFIEQKKENSMPKHFTNITSTAIKNLPFISGELYIDNSNSNLISEADIANKYNVIFPNLSIKAANIKNAYRARFVRVDDGIESEIKVLRFDYPSSAIEINPPNNNEVSTPVHYDFKGWSKTNPNTVSDINNIEIINPNDFSKYDASDFVNGEITFYAIYKKHEYQIHFEDPTALLEGDKYEKIVSIEYGLPLREPSELPLRRFQEENELALTERLSFKGWTTLEDSAGIVGSEIVNNILTDITSYKADRDYYFYAVFVKENVFDVSTDSKYFIFNEEDGSIEANTEYQLSGKITLPAQFSDKNNILKNVLVVGDFSTMTQISHIFFMKGGQYQTVSSRAFYNDATENSNPSLKAVYLPNSITTIKDYAFHGQVNLEYVSENALNDAVEQTFLPTKLKQIGNYAFYADASTSGRLHINALPNELESIGSNAFYNAGQFVTIEELPNSLTSIGTYGFAYLPNLTISSTNQLKTIGSYAFGAWNDFSHEPTSGISVNLFTVESPVLSVASEAFEGYGQLTGFTVVLETSKITELNIGNYFGPNATISKEE